MELHLHHLEECLSVRSHFSVLWFTISMQAMPWALRAQNMSIFAKVTSVRSALK